VHFVHDRGQPKVEVEKQKKIVLATEIYIRLDSSRVNMMAIAVLWARKSVRDTDDEINSQLHWMPRIELLIVGSLVPQCCKHGISEFIGRAGRLRRGYCIKCNDAMCW